MNYLKRKLHFMMMSKDAIILPDMHSWSGLSTQNGTPTPTNLVEVVPYVSAGIYKVPCTSPRGGWWEFTIPNMHGIGSFSDTLTIDTALGGGILTSKNACKVFDGTEAFTAGPNSGTYMRFYVNMEPPHITGVVGQLSVLSNGFMGMEDSTYGRGVNVISGGSTRQMIYFGISTDIATDLMSFETFLVSMYGNGTPIIGVYVVETPTETQITTTWVATSDATELI